MNKADKTNKILLNILTWGIYAALLTPLFVSKHFYFPFISTKVFFFRILIEILFVLWIALVLRGVVALPKWRNFLLWALGIHVLVLFLSIASGVEWYRGFWGSIERGSGMFTYLHYLVFFFILISVCKTKTEWRRLLDIFLAVTFIIGLSALAQKFQLHIVYEYDVARVTGSTGNAAHLAGFLIFGIFLSLAGMMKRPQQWQWREILYGACFSLSVISLLLTQTRGAFLGLLAGFIVWGLALAMVYSKKRMVFIGSITAVATVIAAAGFIFINRDRPFVMNNELLNRFTTINLQDTTAQQRLFSWQTGWRAFKDRPLLGWGMENYHAAFNQYFDASYYDIVKTGTYFDKAHNIIVELLVTNGVLGLLSYLLLLGVMAYHIARRRDGKAGVTAAALLALLAAYVVQNIFVFDTVVTYLAFFLTLGYVYHLHTDGAMQLDNAPAPRFSSALPIAALALALAVAGYLVIWQNIQPARSAYYMRHALNEANKRPYRYADFSALLRRSLSFGTIWDAEYIIEYTTFYKQLREQSDVDTGAVLPDVKFIAAVGERYLPHSHNDAKFISQLAGIYELVYEYGQNEDDLTRAEDLIQQAIALSPGRVFYYHILAQIYEFNGRDEQALATLETARALNDNLGQTYWALGIMYSKLSRHDEAITAVREAVKRRVKIDNADSIVEIVPIFEQEKDYESALFLYRQLLDADKTNTDYYAKIAALYAVMGDDEQAIATAYQIINLNSATAPQVNAFIDEVRAGKFHVQ